MHCLLVHFAFYPVQELNKGLLRERVLGAITNSFQVVLTPAPVIKRHSRQTKFPDCFAHIRPFQVAEINNQIEILFVLLSLVDQES